MTSSYSMWSSTTRTSSPAGGHPLVLGSSVCTPGTSGHASSASLMPSWSRSGGGAGGGGGGGGGRGGGGGAGGGGGGGGVSGRGATWMPTERTCASWGRRASPGWTISRYPT